MQKRSLKKLACGSAVAILVILALATVFEKINGSEWVSLYIYKSLWFVLLWGVLGITSALYIMQQKLYKIPSSFLLHCALLLILLGALITYTTGQRGQLHLRQGEICDKYISEEDLAEKALPFSIKLVLFDIEYHPDSDEPADYISFLKIDEEIHRVSMNKIYKKNGYRLYQLSYDPDEMGSILQLSYDPWGVGVTYAGYLLLALSMFWLLWRKNGWKGVVYTTIPVALVWVYISQLNPMTPILRTPMLAAHVSVIMVSYSLLVYIAICGAVALCNKKHSKRLYRQSSVLLYPALFLLAAGIFIGAVWANISWGRYWGWDAKETWALITMLLYALPFHKQSIPFFRNPKNFHLFCLLAILTVAMTFFGVTFLLGGIHSYVG